MNKAENSSRHEQKQNKILQLFRHFTQKRDFFSGIPNPTNKNSRKVRKIKQKQKIAAQSIRLQTLF